MYRPPPNTIKLSTLNEPYRNKWAGSIGACPVGGGDCGSKTVSSLPSNAE